MSVLVVVVTVSFALALMPAVLIFSWIIACRLLSQLALKWYGDKID